MLLLLQACLNVNVFGTESRVVFGKPILPPYLYAIWIRGLRVGDALVDVTIERHGDNIPIDVPRKEGAVEVFSVE